MIGKLNHVAIATSDLANATAVYRDVLGAKVDANARAERCLLSMSGRSSCS